MPNDFQPLEIRPMDLKFIEIGNENVDKIVRDMGIPPHLLAMNAAMVADEILQFQRRIFAQGARLLEPSFRKWEQAMSARMAWRFREGRHLMPKVKRHFWERP